MRYVFLSVFVLLGAASTSILISVLDWIQGLLINDWSGVHPINRLSAIPIRIVLAILGAVSLTIIAAIMHKPPLLKPQHSYLFGAACGLVTISSLLEPWVSRDKSFTLLVFVLALAFALWVRVSLERKPAS